MIFRKLRHSIYIFISILLLFNNVSNVNATSFNSTNDIESTVTSEFEWPVAPSVTAESAIIMDASTGVVLYEKNSVESKYPASITKIMTSLIAIENSSLSDSVTFSRDAVFGVDLDSSRIGIDVGETISMQDCLYGIMLASANEVSYAVAEHVGGTLDNFVDMMNERASELGCVNTHFANPHGLQNENHYTCAYDMSLIAREAIRNTTFAKITGTRTYVIAPTNIQTESRPLANHHKFIKGDISYPGVIGGKTGYTSSAKYTLVTYAQRNDMELICVVMGSDSVNSEYSDTASLLDFGFDNFSVYDVSNLKNEFIIENKAFFTKYSPIFSANTSFLSTGEDGYIVLPNTISPSEVTREVTYNRIDTLIEGNNVIGHVNYYYQDRCVGQTDINYNNTPISTLPTMINTFINHNGLNTITKTKKINLSIWTLPISFICLITIFFLSKEYRRIQRRKAYRKRRQAYKKYRKSDF